MVKGPPLSVETMDGLLVRPRQEKLKIGAFDLVTGSSTEVVENPMPDRHIWPVGCGFLTERGAVPLRETKGLEIGFFAGVLFFWISTNQFPNKAQNQTSNHKHSCSSFGFGIWILELIWKLDCGNSPSLGAREFCLKAIYASLRLPAAETPGGRWSGRLSLRWACRVKSGSSRHGEPRRYGREQGAEPGQIVWWFKISDFRIVKYEDPPLGAREFCPLRRLQVGVGPVGRACVALLGWSAALRFPQTNFQINLKTKLQRTNTLVLSLVFGTWRLELIWKLDRGNFPHWERGNFA
jgi:hypothetical protein